MAKIQTDVLAEALSCTFDAGQRLVLFLDALRQRGLQYEEHQSQLAPHVLDYDDLLAAKDSRAAFAIDHFV